jgi:putative tryptophan/tyrosine transport system substrate-binding protein
MRHRSEDREANQSHDSAECAGAGGQGNPVSVGRKVYVLALAGLLLGVTSAGAQQPTSIPRLGYVSSAGGPRSTAKQLELVRQGLRDLGYIEGKNINIEYRSVENLDRLPSILAELLQLKVDIIYVGSLTAIRAAKQATTTIPIVMMTTADPVAAGLVDSLARPGGNITGLTLLIRELTGKQLELLKEVVPTASRVGFLLDTDSNPAMARFQEYEASARKLKMVLSSLQVTRRKPDFRAAFQSAEKERLSALIIVRSSLFIDHRQQIAELAIKQRLPSMTELHDYVDAGGLMSYAPNTADSYRRLAFYIDKILKGAKPADLPVEQPTKFELVINVKTAKQISLTIPPNVLARADRVIK